MNAEEAFKICPLIAILRGIKPDEVVSVGNAIVAVGFTCLEVPLNSPDPLTSINRLCEALGKQAIIGAGTVLHPNKVLEVAKCGGRIIVTPNVDVSVIQAAKENNLYCMVGFSTPTEAFRAIDAGADALKFFPATSAATLKAIKAVLPKEIPVFPVGGINHPSLMQEYREAGAAGFGLGSAIYQPGYSPLQAADAARVLYDIFRYLPKS